MKFKKECVLIGVCLFLIAPLLFITKDCNYYENLERPFFALDLLVITIIWLVMSLCEAFYFMKVYILGNEKNKNILGLLLLAFILNAGYLFSMFFIQKIFASVVLILFLICTLFLVIIKSFEIKNKYWYLGICYLLWIIYTAILTIFIYLLN